MFPRRSAVRLSLLAGSLLLAGSVAAADLLQVYREALVNDAQYAAARATVEAGREKLPQGLAGLLPTIGGTANTVWNENEYSPRNLPNWSRDFNSNSWNVNLTQPLFRWQNIVQYGQAQWQVAQAEANFAQASQDLILRVAQAYFDVLYAEENLKAVRAAKRSIAQQLEQAKKNFEVGTATITDTHEAQSRYDLASAQELAGENDLQVKQYALRVLVGKDVGALSRLRAEATLQTPQPASMEKWVEAAGTTASPSRPSRPPWKWPAGRSNACGRGIIRRSTRWPITAPTMRSRATLAWRPRRTTLACS